MRAISEPDSESFRRPDDGDRQKPVAELIVRHVSAFERLPRNLNDFRPNVFANYLFELATSFHASYKARAVLKTEEPARSSRWRCAN